MPYKTILALFQNEQDADILLDSVEVLARAQQARVLGFHPEIVPAAYAMAGGFPDIEMLQQAAQRAAQATAALSARFNIRASVAGLDSAWLASSSVLGEHSAGALSIARASDLIVTTQPNPDSENLDIDTLLHESGRPVLILPRQSLKRSSFERIVIGWNGSREAARAAFDALPFLLRADAVDLLVLDPEQRREGTLVQGEMIVSTLAQHGVQVTRVATSIGSKSIEEAIFAHANANGCDLLVMGAFGHSWLREFLFGGVTRAVMEQTSIPTLMSH